MLEATTRPAMVPGWWRGWPAWSPYAAFLLPLPYGITRLAWAPGWLWPFWGIGLAVATIAYYHCRHDQGRAAAGPPLGRGAPC
jgi:hypothetical protein